MAAMDKSRVPIVKNDYVHKVTKLDTIQSQINEILFLDITSQFRFVTENY